MREIVQQIVEVHHEASVDFTYTKLHEFEYGELIEATKSFSRESIIHDRGYGEALMRKFETPFDTTHWFAVEVIDTSRTEDDNAFVEKVQKLPFLRHPNIVRLIGYCREKHMSKIFGFEYMPPTSRPKCIILLEYMPSTSLEYYLHDPTAQPLDWTRRLMIAAGVARGLDFLHNEANPQVIYKHLTSTNVLVGEKCSKLSDVWIATFCVEDGYDQPHPDYCSPEHASTGKFTIESDIFSFGVLLLELISGKKPLDYTRGRGVEFLTDWVRPRIVSWELSDVIDPVVAGHWPRKRLENALKLALQCIRPQPITRPTIGEVLKSMERLLLELHVVAAGRPASPMNVDR